MHDSHIDYERRNYDRQIAKLVYEVELLKGMIETLNSQIHNLIDKLDNLQAERNKVIGGIAAIGAVVGTVWTIFTTWPSNK